MDKPPLNTQNVIVMTKYQPETGFAAISQVEAYWEAIRGARLLPKRSDIDPRGIERALENAFILERIAPGIARLRVAGSHLNDLMGMEVRGMPLTSFFVPGARASVSDLLEVVFQTPAIGSLRMISQAGPQKPELQARMILLPLKSDLGDVSRVLGCFVSKGEMGLAPRRYDITAKEVLTITAGQPPQPAVQTDPATQAPTLGTVHGRRAKTPCQTRPKAPPGLPAPDQIGRLRRLSATLIHRVAPTTLKWFIQATYRVFRVFRTYPIPIAKNKGRQHSGWRPLNPFQALQVNLLPEPLVSHDALSGPRPPERQAQATGLR
jgi:hypothetical protein